MNAAVIENVDLDSPRQIWAEQFQAETGRYPTVREHVEVDRFFASAINGGADLYNRRAFPRGLTTQGTARPQQAAPAPQRFPSPKQAIPAPAAKKSEPVKKLTKEELLATIFTDFGLKWAAPVLEKTTLKDIANLAENLKQLERNEVIPVSDDSYNCGGGTLQTSHGYEGNEMYSLALIVAAKAIRNKTVIFCSWNHGQYDNTGMYKSLGFVGPTEWERNANSGNRIRGMVGVVPKGIIKDTFWKQEKSW